MILTGTLHGVPDEPVRVRLTADVSQFIEATTAAIVATEDFGRYLLQTARNMTALDVKLDVLGSTADGVWAKFYTRGAMDPNLATPDARDEYLRALGQLHGDRGHAARSGFLRGWFEHRADTALDEPTQALSWHRLIGDTAVSVGREQERAT